MVLQATCQPKTSLISWFAPFRTTAECGFRTPELRLPHVGKPRRPRFPQLSAALPVARRMMEIRACA
jgi:hypothetical protein